MIQKVISGGQTGADRAGLAVAKELGIPTGGWAPAGYLTEEGSDPTLAEFGLQQTASSEYPERTKKNIKEADGTLLFGSVNSRGCKLTLDEAKRTKKPYLIVAWASGQAVPYGGKGVDQEGNEISLPEWIKKNRISVLNVAGNSESKQPGIFDAAKAYLVSVLAESKAALTVAAKTGKGALGAIVLPIADLQAAWALHTYISYSGAERDAVVPLPDFGIFNPDGLEKLGIQTKKSGFDTVLEIGKRAYDIQGGLEDSVLKIGTAAGVPVFAWFIGAAFEDGYPLSIPNSKQQKQLLERLSAYGIVGSGLSWRKKVKIIVPEGSHVAMEPAEREDGFKPKAWFDSWNVEFEPTLISPGANPMLRSVAAVRFDLRKKIERRVRPEGSRRVAPGGGQAFDPPTLKELLAATEDEELRGVVGWLDDNVTVANLTRILSIEEKSAAKSAMQEYRRLLRAAESWLSPPKKGTPSAIPFEAISEIAFTLYGPDARTASFSFLAQKTYKGRDLVTIIQNTIQEGAAVAPGEKVGVDNAKAIVRQFLIDSGYIHALEKRGEDDEAIGSDFPFALGVAIALDARKFGGNLPGRALAERGSPIEGTHFAVMSTPWVARVGKRGASGMLADAINPWVNRDASWDAEDAWKAKSPGVFKMMPMNPRDVLLLLSKLMGYRPTRMGFLPSRLTRNLFEPALLKEAVPSMDDYEKFIMQRIAPGPARPDEQVQGQRAGATAFGGRKGRAYTQKKDHDWGTELGRRFSEFYSLALKALKASPEERKEYRPGAVRAAVQQYSQAEIAQALKAIKAKKQPKIKVEASDDRERLAILESAYEVHHLMNEGGLDFQKAFLTVMPVGEELENIKAPKIKPELFKLLRSYGIPHPSPDTDFENDPAARVEMGKALLQLKLTIAPIRGANKGELLKKAKPWQESVLSQMNPTRAPRPVRPPRPARSNPIEETDVTALTSWIDAGTKPPPPAETDNVFARLLGRLKEKDPPVQPDQVPFEKTAIDMLFPKKGPIDAFEPKKRISALTAVDLPTQAAQPPKKKELDIRIAADERLNDQSLNYILDQAQLTLQDTVSISKKQYEERRSQYAMQPSTALLAPYKVRRLKEYTPQPGFLEAGRNGTVILLSPPMPGASLGTGRVMTFRYGTHLDLDMSPKTPMEGMGFLVGKALTAALLWLGEKDKRRESPIYLGRVGSPGLQVAWRPGDPRTLAAIRKNLAAPETVGDWDPVLDKAEYEDATTRLFEGKLGRKPRAYRTPQGPVGEPPPSSSYEEPKEEPRVKPEEAPSIPPETTEPENPFSEESLLFSDE